MTSPDACDLPHTSVSHAIVRRFGESRLCKVLCYGTAQESYTNDRVLWVEREEDLYAIAHYTPPFCVLRREDFLRGTQVD